MESEQNLVNGNHYSYEIINITIKIIFTILIPFSANNYEYTTCKSIYSLFFYEVTKYISKPESFETPSFLF